MIPLMDFQDRSLNGPVMKADAFDLAYSMKIRELVEKYGIKHNPGRMIVDDDTADAVFNAGVDLLAETGLYNLTTQRVITYSKEEILEFVNERKENPARIQLGLGDDEMVIAYRTGKDPRPPVLYAGAAGVISEEEFIPHLTAFAREKILKGMGISGGIERVGDIEPKAGTLSEIYCGLWEQERLQEVLEAVGRPGLSLGLLCTVSTAGATMACLDRGFRGPHNTHIGVHIIPEQKIDWDRLILAHFCEDRGIVPWQSAMSLIGGLCRDAADAAVSMIANVLGQMSYAHGPMCSLFPTHIDGTWATRDSIWAVSAAARASERNIRLAIGSCTVSSSPWWGIARIGILQEAVSALVYTASGLSYAWIAGAPNGFHMIDKIMKLAATMDHDQVSVYANKIMEKIDELSRIDTPMITTPTFKDMYDLETIQPKPEFQEALNQARQELINIGLPLEE